MSETERLTMLGYWAKLTLELDGEEYDISRLVRVDPDAGGWTIDAQALAMDLAIEWRARARAAAKP